MIKPHSERIRNVIEKGNKTHVFRSSGHIKKMKTATNTENIFVNHELPAIKNVSSHKIPVDVLHEYILKEDDNHDCLSMQPNFPHNFPRSELDDHCTNINKRDMR